MNRKISTILFLLLLIFIFGVVCLLLRSGTTPEEGVAKVHMLNVGQGDAFFIEAANGKQLLIDSGRDATVLTELAKIMPRGDRSIDIVLATHPDADHIGGLPHVLQRYNVGLFLTSDVLTDTKVFTALYALLDEKDIASYYVRQGMTITLEKNTDGPRTTFEVLFPDRSTTHWETNSASVIGRLQIGKRTALFTGDAPSSIEHFLSVSIPNNIDVDILKLGHHGSKTSTSIEFLKATSPTLALISAGVDNRYGHPAKETVQHLQVTGVPWISTQDKGTVTLTSDGVKWRVE